MSFYFSDGVGRTHTDKQGNFSFVCVFKKTVLYKNVLLFAALLSDVCTSQQPHKILSVDEKRVCDLCF